jgi:EAL domain-containing protein (putative c-di-GMP-specific phosphodiesterase class I)
MGTSRYSAANPAAAPGVPPPSRGIFEFGACLDTSADQKRIAQLGISVGTCLHNFTAARTHIRDYLINPDPRHFGQVERRLAGAFESLSQAGGLPGFPAEHEAIRAFHEEIGRWRGIAHELQRAVEQAKAAFAAADRDQPAESRSSRAGSQPDAYAQAARDAINARSRVCQLFETQLAPLGAWIQGEAERLHESLIRRQHRNEEIGRALHAELERAIQRGEMELFYQPKVNLRTGDMDHVEALLRWNHPLHGLIAPGKFIGMAELAGCIGLVTRFAIDHALRQCARWESAGRPIRAAVNISAHDLLEPDLCDWLQQRMTAHLVGPHCIALEITESALMQDPPQARRALQALRALGLRLSIDDYGTGYASLAYLGMIPAQEMKIDKSFVQSMLADRDKAAIVRSTIDLGHDLGLAVVAEGVEDRPTLERLRALGCDFAQGHYISKPVPIQQFDQWIAANSGVFAMGMLN